MRFCTKCIICTLVMAVTCVIYKDVVKNGFLFAKSGMVNIIKR